LRIAVKARERVRVCSGTTQVNTSITSNTMGRVSAIFFLGHIFHANYAEINIFNIDINININFTTCRRISNTMQISYRTLICVEILKFKEYYKYIYLTWFVEKCCQNEQNTKWKKTLYKHQNPVCYDSEVTMRQNKSSAQ